jgi:hypothetical protein
MGRCARNHKIQRGTVIRAFGMVMAASARSCRLCLRLRRRHPPAPRPRGNAPLGWRGLLAFARTHVRLARGTLFTSRRTTAGTPECNVRGPRLQCPLNVDSSRPECANTGHSPTVWRTGQNDAKPSSHPGLGQPPLAISLPPGKRAAQVYLVLFCMTREGAPCPKPGKLRRS